MHEIYIYKFVEHGADKAYVIYRTDGPAHIRYASTDTEIRAEQICGALNSWEAKRIKIALPANIVVEDLETGEKSIRPYEDLPTEVGNRLLKPKKTYPGDPGFVAWRDPEKDDDNE